ncbi:MAG: thioredoxin-family protein [Caulobacter sp.]|nr:thioredoxin-family protein [Caulobacter sp.]
MPSLSIVMLLGLALVLAGSGARAAATTPQLTLLPLDGAPAPVRLHNLAGHPRILLFWRSDCAPCRLELAAIGDLEAAAGSGRLMTVALEPAASARATLSSAAARPASSWFAKQAPARVLTAFGGAPPRLPLAVAIDRSGRVCASRHGLLGSDIVRQWVRQCLG